MAQMQACTIDYSDINDPHCNLRPGFVGICCKFCGRQNGNSETLRLFPQTLRMFIQSPTRKSIVKHMAVSCQSVPAELRRAFEDMGSKGSDVSTDFSSSNLDLFFARVWDRIHGDNAPELSEMDNFVRSKLLPSSGFGHHEGRLAVAARTSNPPAPA